MNTLSYVLLSLLARESLAGYDIMLYLKKRFSLFWPVSHTQIYPALAQLEEQGMVIHHIVEQYAVRPDKKVYEITDQGRAALQQWVEAPTSALILRDEFYIKAYSLWLADPERMAAIFREQMQVHETQIEQYRHMLQEKLSTGVASQDGTDLSELTSLLFQYKIGYEQNYLSWCQSVLRYLEHEQQIREE